MHLLVQKRTQQYFLTICILLSGFIGTQEYSHSQHCSVRLENALEHMRRRNGQTKSRSLELTPYSVYQSIYGSDNDDNNESENRFQEFFSTNSRSSNGNRQPHNLPISRVEIEDMKVRLPMKAVRWVEVDKCTFTMTNRTLDTRLIFPDLTLSGKVVLHPTGGKCNMILRLRHAGIEFHTVPMNTGMDESRNSRPVASVRTDSHFAEPGFISVFAHGCQGPTGIKLRQNSKRRFGFTSNDEMDMHAETNNQRRWGKYQNSIRPLYDPRDETRHQTSESIFSRRFIRDVTAEHYSDDQIYFKDDIFNFEDDLVQLEPDARAFAEIFSKKMTPDRNNPKWHSTAEYSSSSSNTNADDINNALTKELEQLFSMGVKGLLTTYMQRALQPAIKETLMENMGYTISYG